MDAGQIISIIIQVIVVAIGIGGSVMALRDRLVRMESKLDAFAGQCLLKHMRVDEKLEERKKEIDGLGKKLNGMRGERSETND